ncbi:MAG: acyl-CoA thioesterase domain-containing protein [Ilumatobacteraceae bacterium]
MALVQCAYRARAWCGDELVADSTGAIRDEGADRAPILWFPVGDVRAGALERLGDAAGLGTGELDGHVAFDPERIRLGLVNGTDHALDSPLVRFPNWGDAADLIDMIDVRPAGERRYVSVPRADWRRPVVEGSQILGQMIVAAMRQTDGRRAVSASIVLIRPADARAPLTFVLDVLSHGRTFSTVSVRVEQGDRVCAAGILLLDSAAAEVIRHAVQAPDVPPPHDTPPHDMGVTGRDLRIVDAAYTGDPHAPVGPPVLDAWVRFADVPDDPAIHAGLLAQFTGHLSIGAALRAHDGVGEQQAHVTLSTGINAISISFHRDVQADEWLLYHQLSTSAADGMTHSECRVHDIDGDLLASFTVEAMVREFSGSTTGDYRSAL